MVNGSRDVYGLGVSVVAVAVRRVIRDVRRDSGAIWGLSWRVRSIRCCLSPRQ